MNYIYDIYLNYNEILYEFYEWHKKDKIMRIKKIPIFKISSDALRDIVSNKIKIHHNFLESIMNKTISYNNNKFTSCLFTDCEHVISVLFDLESGNSIKKSNLYIEEELDVLDISERLDEYKIEYKVLSLDKQLLKTRKENSEYNFLVKGLKNVESDLIKYLYLECFDKEIQDEKEAYIKIRKILNNSNTKEYKKLYNLLSYIKSL